MIWNPFKKPAPAIVVVCSANITRSPYFEHLLRKIIADKPIPLLANIKITSAGVDAHPGVGAHPVISLVANMNGFPIARHRSKRFDKSVARISSLVLTMETRHKEKILEWFPDLKGKVYTLLEYGRNEGDLESYDVPDPTGREVEDFREFLDTADNEGERVRNILAINGLPSDLLE
jgi:protein-tyrosine-phosphatase